VALRIRKYLIPFYATSSAIVLLITDTISSKVIILNLLAIGLLLKADNAVAVLFLSNRYDVMMDNAVGEVDGGASGAARGMFFWTRVQGLLCAYILVGAMYRIEQFVTNCSNLEDFLNQCVVSFNLHHRAPVDPRSADKSTLGVRGLCGGGIPSGTLCCPAETFDSRGHQGQAIGAVVVEEQTRRTPLVQKNKRVCVLVRHLTDVVSVRQLEQTVVDGVTNSSITVGQVSRHSVLQSLGRAPQRRTFLLIPRSLQMTSSLADASSNSLGPSSPEKCLC